MGRSSEDKDYRDNQRENRHKERRNMKIMTGRTECWRSNHPYQLELDEYHDQLGWKIKQGGWRKG